MQVHFTPEQEAQLATIAEQTGTDMEELVRGAALRFVEESQEFRDTVRLRVEQADRGDFIDEDEMDRRVARMIRA